VTIGQILARTLVRSGYRIVVTQSYQSRIRGGHNTFAIRASAREIAAPRESVDLILALNEETVTLHREALSDQGLIVADEALGVADDVGMRVPYKQLAKDRALNVAALGVVASLIGLNEGLTLQTMEEAFGKKDAGVAEENRKALTNSFGWCASQPSRAATLPRVSNPRQRLMMNGNEAIALGAISAGLKFCSFYPMTPATSIVLNLIIHAKKMGLVVEQAEDEIAAVNMAIGASFAGAPSMVATSGGGFALMVEGVSLAAMTETPVVVAVAQRPGPATGLPTRTEQGDLEFVLHAGHGEFPRAVIAPGSVEECFHLTRRAFELAEQSQGPIFVLTDQFLADSYRAVEPFEVGHLSEVRCGVEASSISEPYRRYAITDSGVSPRMLPGLTKHLVVADSDEHTEDGHLTEDLAARTPMADKRLRKADGLMEQVVEPEFKGDDRPDILLVSWGSSKGAVAEAVDLIRRDGKTAATLHFSQVWPLVPGQFVERLEEAREVVCVEGNATGQFARLIRRETGFEIRKRILRYDGLPMTPEFVLRGVEGA
jgi:2-oxoglutarate ferredoxin oxidoreductase subunit alpha